jgi:general secretion pathway protein A
MDLDYWGFRRCPFERSYAADRFFFSPIHEEAFARVLFLVEEFRRTGMLIGPAGTGKTFVLKLLQQRAERMGRLAIRCDATGSQGDELIAQIAIGCFVPCDAHASLAQLWGGLRDRFAALTLIQQPVVIIVDHYDSVDPSCHQSLRRLRHLADSMGLKLTIIVGTSDKSMLTALQDTVELRIDLASWTVEETSRFIHSTISEAGVSVSLFTDDAVSSIYQYSGGIPARIVTLCNLVLLAAMDQDQKLVTSELVEAVTHEMHATTHNSRLARDASANGASMMLHV